MNVGGMARSYTLLGEGVWTSVVSWKLKSNQIKNDLLLLKHDHYNIKIINIFVKQKGTGEAKLIKS